MRRPWGRLAAVGVVAAAVSALLAPTAAQAVACGAAVAAGTDCTMTGTVTVSGGTLSLTSPSSLSWADTLDGLDQSAVDVTSGDQQYTVNDATGTGSGWHVTAAATTFATGSDSLPDSGTLETTGSTTSASATAEPTGTCAATCTLPNDTTTYPVTITTAASAPTPVTVYDAPANSGLGKVIIGGSAAAAPVGWWVNIPANAIAGTYTSTLTLAVVSAP